MLCVNIDEPRKDQDERFENGQGTRCLEFGQHGKEDLVRVRAKLVVRVEYEAGDKPPRERGRTFTQLGRQHVFDGLCNITATFERGK